MFSDFKSKISDENEKRVVQCLKLNMEKHVDALDTLSDAKENVAEQVLSKNVENDKIVFENIWALNAERKKILRKNLDFVNSM